MKFRTLIASAIFTSIATAAVFAQMNHGDHSKMDMKAPLNDAAAAFKAVNDKMHKDMTMDFTGDADVDFARGMIPHHKGAVDMAKVVLQYGKDPELKKLATEIIKSQESEIAFMKSWLAKNGK
ncbi:MAG: DUF305 domain-containing protein [Hyphomicrobiales bacterium]|nr:DUF305 domain-containing protein [Hyphomicrobiales bacterium]